MKLRNVNLKLNTLVVIYNKYVNSIGKKLLSKYKVKNTKTSIFINAYEVLQS
jgi:hypothetical protein